MKIEGKDIYCISYMNPLYGRKEGVPWLVTFYNGSKDFHIKEVYTPTQENPFWIIVLDIEEEFYTTFPVHIQKKLIK